MGFSRGAKQDRLLPGTLDMLVLQTLSYQPMHGYGIAQFIRQRSEEVLQVGEGSLSTRRSSNSRSKAWSRRSGESRTRDDGPATTGSPRSGAPSSGRNSSPISG